MIWRHGIFRFCINMCKYVFRLICIWTIQKCIFVSLLSNMRFSAVIGLLYEYQAWNLFYLLILPPARVTSSNTTREEVTCSTVSWNPSDIRCIRSWKLFAYTVGEANHTCISNKSCDEMSLQWIWKADMYL